MAIIKKAELVRMDEKTLLSKLEELKKEFITVNAQRATGTLPTNPGKIKEIRRTIARILTILNQIKRKKILEKSKKKEEKPEEKTKGGTKQR